MGLRPSREAPEERGRAYGKKKRGWVSGRGLWTPQLRQGLHGPLADGAGEGIQRLLLDLPLDRAPQRQDEGQAAAGQGSILCPVRPPAWGASSLLKPVWSLSSKAPKHPTL